MPSRPQALGRGEGRRRLRARIEQTCAVGRPDERVLTSCGHDPSPAHPGLRCPVLSPSGGSSRVRHGAWSCIKCVRDETAFNLGFVDDLRAWWRRVSSRWAPVRAATTGRPALATPRRAGGIRAPPVRRRGRGPALAPPPAPAQARLQPGSGSGSGSGSGGGKHTTSSSGTTAGQGRLRRRRRRPGGVRCRRGARRREAGARSRRHRRGQAGLRRSARRDRSDWYLVLQTGQIRVFSAVRCAARSSST